MYLKCTIKCDILCVSAAQAASKSLLEAIGETYESQWTGHDLLYVQTQSVDMLWQDFSHKLADQVLLPLNTYQAQFPEMRVRFQCVIAALFICICLANVS